MDSPPLGGQFFHNSQRYSSFPCAAGRLILPRAWPMGRPPLSRLFMFFENTDALRNPPHSAYRIWFGFSARYLDLAGNASKSSSIVPACKCCCRSFAMLTILIGFSVIEDRIFLTALFKGLSPLVIIHRSAQRECDAAWRTLPFHS